MNDDARNDAHESESGALKSEVARLRQQLQRQNALLRPLLLSQRPRPLRLHENHEALSVTVSTLTTVNLSYIDTGLVTQVASFVGTSRELLNLALTCKAFGWWQPGSEWYWSLAEEVARRAVCSRRTNLQDSESVKLILPEYVRGRRTWLAILHESEHPLKFNTLLGRLAEYSSCDRTSVRNSTERGNFGAALASGFVMMSGIHYAEFEIRGCPYIGIVRPMPNLDLQRLARREDFHFFDMEFFDYFLAARGVRKFGVGIVHACEYCCEDGYSSWTDWDDKQDIMNWDGMEYCRTGDTVGMLLDLGVGILTIYKNSRRLGVMKDGLSGPYCWYASLTRNSAVSIKRGEASSAGGLPRFQMTDGQSNERLKTTARADGRNINDAINDAHELEIGALESKVARLKRQLQRQNALLRPLLLSQRLRPLRLQENHNELSVTVSTLTKVNLSYVDTSLIAQVASFVGASRELLNLALTCKAFGWWQSRSGSEWDWSLADEVARQMVCSGQNNINGVRVSLPRYVRGMRTWLSILHESERPLKFNTLLGRHIEYSSGDRTSARNSAGRGYFGEALASGFVMMSGIHYAEFQIIGNPHFGIVRPMPNIILRMLARHETLDFFENEFYDDFLAARTDEWVGTVHTCEYSCEDGELSWTGWDIENEQEQFMVEWEGMEGCMTGDTIGMLLDLDEGKVTVYKNNRRLGVLKDGLSGPYCWYANVTTKSAVSIKRGEPPRI